MNKRLETELFKSIVEHTPLISIDLIIRNEDGKALLGQRLNRPAQNYWFVPGGRILKDESFENAFKRVTFEELGVQISINEAKFLGIYEHFYSDNFSGTCFSTHYVVHGYEISLMPHQIKEGANKRGNSSRLTQSFHFFMFEPIFSPVNALNQPI